MIVEFLFVWLLLSKHQGLKFLAVKSSREWRDILKRKIKWMGENFQNPKPPKNYAHRPRYQKHVQLCQIRRTTHRYKLNKVSKKAPFKQSGRPVSGGWGRKPVSLWHPVSRECLKTSWGTPNEISKRSDAEIGYVYPRWRSTHQTCLVASLGLLRGLSGKSHYHGCFDRAETNSANRKAVRVGKNRKATEQP